ncbi:MAG: pyruvate ferredoxin oxidoreductase [Nitrososphaerota archaeon]|jgi:pyruvate ferredoxin oxidoreductase alpha subunit|nr:pyruvate ferredoxin oxidoreductase [Nitrososphaerota archaeon]MDG7038681.1 pyruvate ferredoxin oxidoreductase [Nitrososphaerota archaeon]MDG7043697.1 pyruvate ferredoxin oxidoreductase [Nitrososphaerota archaeon]
MAQFESVQTRKSLLTGDEAVAHAVRQSNVDLVAAYPITPQTIIVERIADFAASGAFTGQFVPVESEHSAMSACIGGALAGARAFTATASQGLALMHEMLYAASGLRLPISMAIANRALNSPLNIHNDHTDVMGSIDSGWIQLFAENAEEAYDRVIQSFRIAEAVNLPVAVNLDGFTLTHSTEPVEMLSDEAVRGFVGRPPKRDSLMDEAPKSFGLMSLPDSYQFFKEDQSRATTGSGVTISQVEGEYAKLSGRDHGPLKIFGSGSKVMMVMLGSYAGTARTTARQMKNGGEQVGVISLGWLRPFPERQFLDALEGVETLMIMDRSVSYGAPAGPLASDVMSLLYRYGIKRKVIAVTYGLGGRGFLEEDAMKLFRYAEKSGPSFESFFFYGGE